MGNFLSRIFRGLNLLTLHETINDIVKKPRFLNEIFKNNYKYLYPVILFKCQFCHFLFSKSLIV